MDWIVSSKKPDFIGKRSLGRADMHKSGRKQLVGLLPELAGEVLEEGAQIVADAHQAIPMTMLGHVTSSYMSPTLGRAFALALLKDGRARLGERLYVPMLDRTITVTVTEPVFFDRAGERLRA
jgi:sarcosine oxidase subunit alpha